MFSPSLLFETDASLDIFFIVLYVVLSVSILRSLYRLLFLLDFVISLIDVRKNHSYYRTFMSQFH